MMPFKKLMPFLRIVQINWLESGVGKYTKTNLIIDGCCEERTDQSTDRHTGLQTSEQIVQQTCSLYVAFKNL